MKKYLAICLIGLLYGAMGCQSKPSASTESKSATAPAEEHKEAPTDLVELSTDQIKIGNVETGLIENRNLGQVLQVNGRLAVPAQSQLNVTALLGGFVRSIPLLVGQPVRKGQLLARLENPDLVQLQQDYAETSSRLAYLELELARQQELSRENVSALKVLQQTSADLKATRARVTGLAHRIQLVGLSPEAALKGQFSSTYVLTASVNGVVTDVLVSAGGYVQPTDVIARITSNQGLYAELTVFEKDLPQLRTGQRVSIRLNNEPERERSGRITYINQAIDTDRSVRVVARLDQSDARLTPNTFIKASLDLGQSRVTALPEEAIVSAEGKDYIFVITDEKMPEEHEHEAGEKEHSTKEEHDHQAGETEQHGTTFRRIPVRRGVTEGGYSQVILPSTLNIGKTQVVKKGAFAILSQLQAASGEEEGHAH
ncbi:MULTISPECIES: efflux RND transporter periplasmic adaptor subunit [unclassified Spirosoma]|jgi:cobalt-zinc-cadmium efflux system membrane fusion protein|uniref:efflux RND transporter periplasmic adaptor subunit n=1 Tax=unclassified Spirosoma TaxID=2621999 RepID=UPI000969EC78|nr:MULTISPECIES: efflux RND transporter periplasmic adaptor subunit [unclassified Spirosoma]MBN8826897.1 efflux RND transporter periplasmic adaptor subunit [Spirosoma sp.]OJW72933.1 MAG: efflux transporter periplasmic adaptor subunit [Spirosoma sp. 48-14]